MMTVYNGEDYLQDAIYGVLRQSYKDFELIIVNDGSTDSTDKILEETRDSRIRVYSFDTNKGRPYALNYGIRECRGKWIAIHDADDISAPDRLEKQLRFLYSHPDAIGVGSMIKSIPGKRPVSSRSLRDIEWSNKLISQDDIMKFRYVAPPLVHGSVTFLKEAYARTGGYDERFRIGQDFDLWIKLLELGPLYKIPEALYYYRVDPQSLSRAREKETCDESLKIASGHILGALRSRLKREPVFIVVGPGKGCLFYEETVCPFHNIRVHSYYSGNIRNWIPLITGLVREGTADGVLVLDGPNTGRVWEQLKINGLQWNRNYFRLWNIFI